MPICEHLFLVQIFDFWDIFWATIYEKSLTECSVRDFCGEDEIRTRGTLETYVGLANRWFQPLTHLSRGTVPRVLSNLAFGPDCKYTNKNDFAKSLDISRIVFSEKIIIFVKPY